MLSGEVGEKTTKWGPVQVVRASARVVGGKRTIIEKSQQLKEVQDLKVQKGQGIEAGPKNDQILVCFLPRT